MFSYTLNQHNLNCAKDPRSNLRIILMHYTTALLRDNAQWMKKVTREDVKTTPVRRNEERYNQLHT